MKKEIFKILYRYALVQNTAKNKIKKEKEKYPCKKYCYTNSKKKDNIYFNKSNI